jgi:hypothetical protein
MRPRYPPEFQQGAGTQQSWPKKPSVPVVPDPIGFPIALAALTGKPYWVYGMVKCPRPVKKSPPPAKKTWWSAARIKKPQKVIRDPTSNRFTQGVLRLPEQQAAPHCTPAPVLKNNIDDGPDWVLDLVPGVFTGRP